MHTLKNKTPSNKQGLVRSKGSTAPSAKQLAFAKDIANFLEIPLPWTNRKPTKKMVASFIDLHKERLAEMRRVLKEKRSEGSYAWIQRESMKEGY